MRCSLTISSKEDISDALLGVFFHYQGTAVTSMKTPSRIQLRKGEEVVVPIEVDLSRLAPGSYTTKLVLSRQNEMGMATYLDVLMNSYAFEIKQTEDFMHNQKWSVQFNGFLTGGEVKLL